MRPALRRGFATFAVLLACSPASAQERGAVRLHGLAHGLTTTARVLVVGAFPGDEDAALIAFLSRGRHVETGYLSLSRGEAGRNALGTEAGEALGAIRTEELLASRRVDGARQFFTRAYEFGTPRSAEAAFARWSRDELLADMVTVIRAFRPHVMVLMEATGRRVSDGGVRDATHQLTRDAFDAAADTARFEAATHGAPWSVRTLYGRSSGMNRDVEGYDPVAGLTYTEIAGEAQAFQRTHGMARGRAAAFRIAGDGMALRLLASNGDREGTSTPPTIFAGVDTTLARLAVDAPEAITQAILRLAEWSDSVRAVLDLQRPWLAVRPLATLLTLVTQARDATPFCRHPAIDLLSREHDSLALTCDARTLDLDASLDVIRRRTIDALLLAAGVTVEATAGRELLAYGDAMPVSVRLSNHGTEPVIVDGVHFARNIRPSATSLTVPPDSSRSWAVFVSGLTDTHPHWMGRRLQDLFPPSRSPIDGLTRVGAPGSVPLLPSVAIPEDYRRHTDISISMTIAGTSFTTSVGSVTHRVADPRLGIQERPVGGVPSVTLSFGRALEWIPAGKPIDRILGLTIESFSDSARTFSFETVVPEGLRVDSLPASVTLQPRERREVMLRLRGKLTAGRHQFGVLGVFETGARFSEGFREIQYPHIRPIRSYRQSGIWLQAVEIEVPRIRAAYVRGTGDGIPMWLTQLGALVTEIDASQLPVLDLSLYTTIVLGARAHELHRELAAYDPRLIAFVRRGGTLVVQHAEVSASVSALLPYPLGWDVVPERVTSADAPVTMREPGSPLLSWPNDIGPADWREWTQDRALFMPSLIDPRYAMPLEMHDTGEKENRGAVLAARLGKGTFVYTTLTFSRQLAAGVPGAARLLVNLLSAGLRSTGTP